MEEAPFFMALQSVRDARACPPPAVMFFPMVSGEAFAAVVPYGKVIVLMFKKMKP